MLRARMLTQYSKCNDQIYSYLQSTTSTISFLNSTSLYFCNYTELVANTKALLLWPQRTSSLEGKTTLQKHVLQ